MNAAHPYMDVYEVFGGTKSAQFEFTENHNLEEESNPMRGCFRGFHVVSINLPKIDGEFSFLKRLTSC